MKRIVFAIAVACCFAPMAQAAADKACSTCSAPAYVPASWRSARKLTGLYGEGCADDAEGTVVLKCGKANKNGIAKVSLKITPFAGKKISYGSKAVYVDDGPVTVDWGSYKVTIQADGSFFGEPVYGDVRPACMPNAVWNATFGGPLVAHSEFHFPDWKGGREEYYDGYWDWIDAMSVYYETRYVEPHTEVDFLNSTGLAKKYWGIGCFCVHGSQSSELSDGMILSANGNKLVSQAGTDHPEVKITYNSKTGFFKGKMKLIVGQFCCAPVEGKIPKDKQITLKITGVKTTGADWGGYEFLGAMTYKSFSTRLYGFSVACAGPGCY